MFGEHRTFRAGLHIDTEAIVVHDPGVPGTSCYAAVAGRRFHTAVNAAITLDVGDAPDARCGIK